MRVNHEQVQPFLTVLLVEGGQEHTAGFHAHHGPGREIGDGHAGLADELLRLVEGVDAREDDARLAGAVVQGELQQLLGLGHGLAVEHLDRAEIALAEGLEIDEILEQGFDLHIGEVDFLFGGHRFFSLLRCLAGLLRGAGKAGTFEIGGPLRLLGGGIAIDLLRALHLHGRDLELIIR